MARLRNSTKNNYKIIIWVVSALVLVAAAAYAIYNLGPTVSATGTSSLKVQPDEVSVYLTIETRNLTAQDAQTANSGIKEKVVSALLALGLEDKEIQFASYSINPDYDWSNGKQEMRGYAASQQIIVKTKNFDKVPGIVDKSVESGALVTYINFELSDAKQSEYKSKALEAASGDAREKAVSTAKGLGKTLGRLVSVNSQDFNYPGPRVYYASAEAGSGTTVQKAALNLAPQDIEVSATIIVEYKLSFF